MKISIANFVLITFLLFSCNSASQQTADHTDASEAKPFVVFVTGDHEYSSEATMPLLAAELEKHYGMRTVVLKAYPDQNAEENIPGLEALKTADLAVFFLRWRRLPQEQITYIDEYLKSGKPVMGFRTATHSFNYPEGDALRSWNAFGERALGAPPGWGGPAHHTHYGHESSTDVTVIDTVADHPILTGVDHNFHVRSWLYKVLPDYPAKGSTWLLMGKSVNPNTPDAIENPIAWTWTSASGARTFMTTMGHPEDFDVEAVQKVVVNAVHWALGKPAPKWAGKIEMNVPYRGMVETRK
ncbi:MAG TPA: ThuA domain-containing protein [Chryseosolibacter sp.]|jgi:type 1 glutamine amidotransferase|nr:ThuA domain-containing protein [Chryseosolibacter sp.]